jgi:ATP-binding cassette subfamily F protein uup
MRGLINDNLTVAENLAGDSDTVEVQGRSRHVISYLQDFLFEPTRARSKAKVLSGGERNRLLLARIFTKPANVLVLDEPTNDLDAETLDVLEDLLVDYKGTLIIVSHDRDFLDNVVTSTLVFEGGGIVTEHAGGYTDWRNEVERITHSKKNLVPSSKLATTTEVKITQEKSKKLSNKDRQDLIELPKKIAELEAEQTKITAQLADPEIYEKGGNHFNDLQKRLQEIERDHNQASNRWLELENRKT